MVNEITRREIEEFIYREAALLDDRKYEEWLSLLAEDFYYWMPAGRADTDPNKDLSITYDNRNELAQRVARLLHPAAHCQVPVSRTSHLITNIRIEELDDPCLKVYSNFAVFESRSGNQRVFGGHCEHKLRRDRETWRINYKQVNLVNSDGVFNNLTFLF
jgi:3-phenylpropionate/cinnamic acid dioxygenase small subunit